MLQMCEYVCEGRACVSRVLYWGSCRVIMIHGLGGFWKVGTWVHCIMPEQSDPGVQKRIGQIGDWVEACLKCRALELVQLA